MPALVRLSTTPGTGKLFSLGFLGFVEGAAWRRDWSEAPPEASLAVKTLRNTVLPPRIHLKTIAQRERRNLVCGLQEQQL